jgi:fructose-1,6-bisphosphatase II
MGQGDRHKSDQAAVEAMRREMDTVPIDGTIVIGEGERDEAPMLYIGEKVGLAQKPGGRRFPTSRHRRRSARGHEPVRDGRAERDRRAGRVRGGGLLHAPDSTWRSWSSGRARSTPSASTPRSRDNLRAIARSLERDVEDLVVVVLDRPRHEKLIADIRATGARIRLIGDGDLSAGIAAAVVGSGVHAVMGTGGAPEGVLTAAAMRCLNGEIFARLVINKPETRSAAGDGHHRLQARLPSKDLASGDVIFAATGVTDGTLMKGVRFFGDGIRTSSLVMQSNPHRIRFIDSIHVSSGQGEVLTRAMHGMANAEG